jgi:hypothetical protein
MRIRILSILSATLCACWQGQAKGILVKFLPNPPEDSIVRYDVYRSTDSGQMGALLGSILPAAVDTLRYPDVGAQKGVAYFYSIKGVNAGGLESDPSDQTEAALPSLALPDTLRPDSSGSARCPLAASARPLQGVPLSLTLVDSSRFLLRYDAAAGRVEFRPVAGRADTGRVIVRASYYGKFEDRDTLLVVAAASPVASLPAPAAPPGLRAGRGPEGALRLSGLPALARVEILTLQGARVFSGMLRGPEAVVGGSEGAGHRYRAGYLTVRDAAGRLLAALKIPPGL